MPETVSLRQRKTRGGSHQNWDVPDVVLVRDMAQGKQAALEDLYARYARLVHSFARKILRDPATTEEVVQDVFVLVWRWAKNFNPQKGQFPSWLLTITYNRAADYVRRKQLPTVHPDELARGEEFWGRLEDHHQTPQSSSPLGTTPTTSGGRS
ncbi:MAG: sigma-70 family RNA polymerase sigma factor [Deinococcus sp.]|nr:sigma-70 family RNA polymerase sigma factor [Deinococcus sp.]